MSKIVENLFKSFGLRRPFLIIAWFCSVCGWKMKLSAMNFCSILLPNDLIYSTFFTESWLNFLWKVCIFNGNEGFSANKIMNFFMSNGWVKKVSENWVYFYAKEEKFDLEYFSKNLPSIEKLFKSSEKRREEKRSS